jgi:siroheme synthase
MALQRLPAIADALLAAGRDPQDPVAILCDGTTPRQRLLRTTLAEAAAVGAHVDRSSATLIAIGPVVALSDLLAPWLEATPATLPPAEQEQLLAIQG